MPILKHAKKKLKQDKKRTIKNKKLKDTFKSQLKEAKIDKKPESVSKAFSAIDKAAKNNIINDNKAARLKASLTKFVTSDTKFEVPKNITEKAKKAKKAAKAKVAKAAQTARKRSTARSK